jgi:thymidylate synthase ThyX
MTYAAEILADTIAPCGVRLTTFQVTFPRFILAEWNTHRALSRNAASSRAIPVRRLLEQVEQNPFVPEHWGANEPGMQATRDMAPEDAADARATWLQARDAACDHARVLMSLGAHKQLANRLLEPFLWATVIATATEWHNFYLLRCHHDAQPEFRRIACLMRELHATHRPQQPGAGPTLHLPMVPDLEQLQAEGYDLEQIQRISAARCARVSYLTHDGQRSPRADLELADRLESSGHLSPFEHPCEGAGTITRSANLVGWRSYRHRIEAKR